MAKLVDIKGYEGLYKITKDGQVWSVRSKKFIYRDLTMHGYYQVKLCVKKVRKNMSVHRLVALAYLPNPENKPQVNHKNGVKTDNHVNNLEWMTEKENLEHAMDNNLINTKLREQAEEIRALRSKFKVSYKKLAEAYDCSIWTIKDLLCGQTYKNS